MVPKPARGTRRRRGKRPKHLKAPRRKPGKARPARRRVPQHPKKTIRHRRRIAPGVPVVPVAVAVPVAADGREARIRLDLAERTLLIRGLIRLLPDALQKAKTPADRRTVWYELPYTQQSTLRPIRALIARLEHPQRGHPSTWGY